MSSRIAVLAAASLVAFVPAPARALFHIAHVHEVMSGAGGDPSVQYVEIRMAAGGQNVTGNTRLTAFNCDGSTATVLLLVPSNVASAMTDDRFIMATTSFAAEAGITPDFTWDPNVTGNMPTACGMVCWGAPGIAPPAPTWNASDPNQYVDCVAYGPYTGTTKTSTHDGTPPSGTPTTLTPGDGTFSLTRTAFGGNNATDFALACPTPENNAGSIGSFGACSPPTTTTTTTSTTLPPPAPSKCTSAKFKEAGKKAAGKTKCRSKAVGKGEAVDAACLTKAEGKFSAGWTKAEGKGDCATTGDVATIEAKVDAFLADLVTELTGGNPGPSKCTGAKLKVAGKKAASKTKCLSKAAAKALPVDGACISKAEGKFSAGWTKAEGKGDCLAPTGDVAAIEGKVDAFLDDLDSELLP
jgi:hypothetical protein